MAPPEAAEPGDEFESLPVEQRLVLVPEDLLVRDDLLVGLTDDRDQEVQ